MEEVVVQQQSGGPVLAVHSSNGAAGERPSCNGTDAERESGRDKCLAHHKNDSGSYDTSPNGLLPSSAECTASAVSNGEEGMGASKLAP